MTPAHPWRTKAYPVAVAVLLGWLSARDTRASDRALPPQKVVVGIYVSSITGLSLRENRFSADLYVWFRWTGDAGLDPLKTFDVTNGTVTSRSGEVREEHEGFHYASCRMTVEIRQTFDVSRFPRDDHVLRIEIEDAEKEADFVEYIADTEGSDLAPEVQVPGWKLLPHRVSVTRHHYATNYGVIDLPSGERGSDYSQLVVEVPLERESGGYSGKLFFVLLIAVGITLLSFFVRPDQLDPRFGLSIGAIFATVGSLYVAAEKLPDSSVVTLSDWLHMLVFLVIFVTLVESTVALWLWNRGQGRLARCIDLYTFELLTVLYLAGAGLILR